MKYIGLTLFICLVLTACGTVSPNYPTADIIGFGTDGERDAGIRSQVISTKTNIHMILISPSMRDEFNNNIIKYGDRFNPQLIKNEGIVSYGSNYAIRNDMLVDLYIMREFAKMDLGKY